MTREDLYNRIKNAIDEYGDSYITDDNGFTIFVKDGEKNYYKVSVFPDIEKYEKTEKDILAYTE